jgi:hypothetical protein
MSNKVVNIGATSQRGAVVRENEYFRAFADRSIEYTETGVDHFAPMFEKVGIPIARVKTFEEHAEALELVVNNDMDELRSRASLSLEGRMLLAIMDNGDNEDALEIQEKIKRRDSFRVIEGPGKD